MRKIKNCEKQTDDTLKEPTKLADEERIRLADFRCHSYKLNYFRSSAHHNWSSRIRKRHKLINDEFKMVLLNTEILYATIRPNERQTENLYWTEFVFVNFSVNLFSLRMLNELSISIFPLPLSKLFLDFRLSSSRVL